MPNQSVVGPCSRSKSSAESGPSARIRSSTRSATAAFSLMRAGDLRLSVPRNHGNSSVRTSERPLLYASKILRRWYRRSLHAGSYPATRACSTRSWLRPATDSGSSCTEPSRRKTSSTPFDSPLSDRAGARNCRVTKKRRAASAVTFTARKLSGGDSPGDVADDRSQLLGTRPHRPVTRRQVDPRDAAQLRKASEPGLALRNRVLVLVGREPGGDRRGRDVEACVVRQLRRLA